ncbi:uncharacterized protein ACNLHF_027222 [Anomaloglossus baeobatrachus]|uniref:uncharacterized protein LOC142248941 n=1 Tax=Anomaloglossus baeobatrachus TaxID=238106 RepID=UPI003F5019E2
MARNEEKQQGRLNRLWLQKEKAEGLVRDVTVKRPRLGALHTAAEVRRWIPSIKSDMEYYLEQSQLIHYSDRKIQEFQERLDALKKEYQSYLWKLRRLDPSCKKHLWKPRGYTRKRTMDGKVPSWLKTGERPGDALLSTIVLSEDIDKDLCDPEEEEDEQRSAREHEDEQRNAQEYADKSAREHEGEQRSAPEHGATALDLTNVSPQGQDAPLEFSNVNSHPKDVWLRSSYNTGGDSSNKLKDILLSSQAELKGNCAAGKSMVNWTEDRAAGGGERKGILGLDCYTSSEDDDDD